MRRIFFCLIFIILSLALVGVNFVFANGANNHESEIQRGKELVESEASCDQLTDEQLEAVGDYLMEQMHPGESHEAIHQMMGMEEGTEYHKVFHINLAKTMYCGQNGMPMTQMMPMMQMMGEGGNSTMGNMMNGSNWNFGSGWGWVGWIFMILSWIVIIVGIIALIVWLINQVTGRERGKSALDVLKERYAKGEIDKKEFEEKKKDLI